MSPSQISASPVFQNVQGTTETLKSIIAPIRANVAFIRSNLDRLVVTTEKNLRPHPRELQRLIRNSIGELSDYVDEKENGENIKHLIKEKETASTMKTSLLKLLEGKRTS